MAACKLFLLLPQEHTFVAPPTTSLFV